MNASIRRMLISLGALVAMTFVGALGYLWIGHGRWAFGDCVYMTIITISTVGFAELPHLREVHLARGFTITVIVGGVATIAYFQATLTALLVEGAIGQAWRSNRMRKQIEGLVGHVVVAGAGSTGRHVLEELVATQTPFVVIDRDHGHLERLSEDLMEGKMLFIHGDATDDHTLVRAGVERARGVVAALTQDKDNLYVTLSARSLNPSARIVTKIVEAEAAPKMLKAGASSVVNPTKIGGRRMASELIRPEVNEFFDQMLRDKDRNLRLEEVLVPDTSPVVGMALKDTPIRRETGVLVVAVRGVDRAFTYNPEPEFVIAHGTTLIVMGETESIVKLRRLVGSDAGAVSTPKLPSA
jgi:voltage-gated potassium channel